MFRTIHTGQHRINESGYKEVVINGCRLNWSIPDPLRDVPENGTCMRCLAASRPRDRVLLSVNDSKKVHPECVIEAVKEKHYRSRDLGQGFQQSLRRAHGKTLNYQLLSSHGSGQIASPGRLLSDSLFYKALLLQGEETSTWFDDPAFYGNCVYRPSKTVQGCAQRERKILLLEALEFAESSDVYTLLGHSLKEDESYQVNVAGQGDSDVNQAFCFRRAAQISPTSFTLCSLLPFLEPGEALMLDNGSRLSYAEIQRRLNVPDAKNLSFNTVAQAIAQQKSAGLASITLQDGSKVTPLKLIAWLIRQEARQDERGECRCPYAFELLAETLTGDDRININSQTFNRRAALMRAAELSTLNSYPLYSKLANDMNPHETVSLRDMNIRLTRQHVHMIALMGFHEKEYKNKTTSCREWRTYLEPLISSQSNDRLLVPLNRKQAATIKNLKDFLNARTDKIEHYKWTIDGSQMIPGAKDLYRILNAEQGKLYNKGVHYAVHKTAQNDDYIYPPDPLDHEGIQNRMKNRFR